MVILITGASRGIGAALAARFLKESNNTVIAVSRNQNRLNELKNRLKSKDSTSELIIKPVDLTSENDLHAFIGWFDDHFSGLDILVNNAGYLENQPFSGLEKGVVQKMFEVNYLAPAMLIKNLAVKLGHSGSGHVVNIGSMGGYQGSVKFPGLSHYSASKAALAVLTECLAVEYKDMGISFNCLAIGSVDTEMLHEAFPGYEAPLQPEEMAEFIHDFALSGHRFMNGKIIPVSLSTP